MARPRKQIDTTKVHEMALSGCSNTEIANALGCGETTIRTRFGEIVDKARSTRRWRLRKMQNKAAESGNVTMLIWLGKNELEQSDKQTHEHTGKDGGPIETKRMYDVEDFKRAIGETFCGRNGSGHVPANGNGKSVHPGA
jgi:hypothetical protein